MFQLHGPRRGTWRSLAERPSEGQHSLSPGLQLGLVGKKSFKQAQGPSEVTHSPSQRGLSLEPGLGRQGSGRTPAGQELRVSLLSRLGV